MIDGALFRFPDDYHSPCNALFEVKTTIRFKYCNKFINYEPVGPIIKKKCMGNGSLQNLPV